MAVSGHGATLNGDGLVHHFPGRNSELDSLGEERSGFILAQRPFVEAARGVTEAHAAERDAADLQTRVSKPGVFHSDSFLLAAWSNSTPTEPSAADPANPGTDRTSLGLAPSLASYRSPISACPRSASERGRSPISLPSS